MATDNIARYGFRFHSTLHGVAYPKPQRARVASGYGGVDTNAAHVDINVGDPIKMVNDGTVSLAAAGESILGIVCNILPYSKGDGKRPYKNLVYGQTGTIGTDAELAIEYIPVGGVLFEIDCNDASTATTLAAYTALIHENADHILTGDTGATSAKPQLNISTHTAATAGWRIIDISTTQDNVDPAGANFKLIVTCNEVNQAPYVTAGL